MGTFIHIREANDPDGIPEEEETFIQLAFPKYLYNDHPSVPVQYIEFGGAVVSNKPLSPHESIDNFLAYGGYLVCESCGLTLGKRIAAALNFVEGIPTERLEGMVPVARWIEGPSSAGPITPPTRHDGCNTIESPF